VNTCSAIARRSLLLGTLPLAAAAQPSRPSILATTAMVAELARGIGGAAVAVDSLIGEGVDPHLFRPTRADIARLLRADAILSNGHRLEGRMSDVLDRARAAGRPVIAVAEAIPAARLRTHPDYADAADPHLWMDPLLWAECAVPVAALLGRLVSGLDTARSLGALQAEYAKLDAYGRAALAPIPPARRILVTAHDAFSYFGARFGLEVQSIQGLSTEAEASLSRIEALVALMVERRVPAIFAEASVLDRAVRALIEGAAARGHRVALGGSLFSDSMGRPGTHAGTYVGMLDHNITTIARALGGEAPPRGMLGRL
jgi:manganese/zinc/iron transport system substrate-binding protein